MNHLTVRFWGTRGSIPTPGRQTEKYGGNTTCLEVRFGDTVIVIDAGSGIRQLSNAWAEEFDDRPIRAHVLFTHAHWDHIQGFPFFGPAYCKGNAFTILGDEKPTGGVRELLSGQMGGAYFPVPLSAMKADLTFEPATADFEIGPVRVRTMPLPHPGGCLGYRFDADNAAFVLATDSELDRVAQKPEKKGYSPDSPRRYEADFLKFFEGADLLAIDCQYTDEEYAIKAGWGHNSIGAVADLCRQVRPAMVALFHHDPGSHDAKVDDMVNAMGERLDGHRIGGDTLVLGAREFLTLRVGSKFRTTSVAEIHV